MTIKIEDIQLKGRMIRKSDWNDFLVALRDLKVGQSFFVKTLPSNYRLAITVAQTLLNRAYVTTLDKKGRRVGRIS